MGMTMYVTDGDVSCKKKKQQLSFTSTAELTAQPPSQRVGRFYKLLNKFEQRYGAIIFSKLHFIAQRLASIKAVPTASRPPPRGRAAEGLGSSPASLHPQLFAFLGVFTAHSSS